MKTFFYKIATILFISANVLSCGPSAAELELAEIRAKQMQDSIAAQLQAQAQRQEELRSTLIQLKAELAGAETKLQSIQEFQLMRTANEKAEQVAAQTMVIENLKANIADVEAQLAQ